MSNVVNVGARESIGNALSKNQQQQILHQQTQQPPSNKFISSKQPTPHIVLGPNGNLQQFQRLTITGHNGIAMPGGGRINDILVESQKVIYAPPSREKSKQTMRSPMIDKQPILNVSQVNNNAPIAGSVTGFGGLVGASANDEYNLMQASIYSGGAMPPPHSSGNGAGAGGVSSL